MSALERAGTGWEMPCELSGGRASVLGVQPHIPALGPCEALEEVGKMRGFDGTNSPESTQAGGWDREEAGFNGVFVELHRSLAPGKEGRASVCGAIP